MHHESTWSSIKHINKLLDISSSRTNNTKERILVDGLHSYNGRAKLYFTEANSTQHIEIIT